MLHAVPDNEPRRYLIRTFGCQMNAHDSERLAGVLEADGLVAAVDVEDADVVVLNTCCIRENADNKLYGHLGHLKSLRDRRPELQIAVGGAHDHACGKHHSHAEPGGRKQDQRNEDARRDAKRHELRGE